MDIRHNNRWNGFEYMELYHLYDALCEVSYDPRDPGNRIIRELVHELNEEMIERQKGGEKYSL